ncbi:efflux transporter periplasmic adaptor subunit [Rubrivivax gelatinosus]|uniref:efflux RND transporter periplasmic adaptor subunit n=1 Tax=Rubrivivax gelatinosus TaxID=28068 RepID=UPI00190554E4|nr:efflux RND transporter periplasmic adaptor subunit [Rubrivivax gelatinosus]MBK1615924.1 efflux transporter periplasmic adaptor subunit [Rubrivivax gelatinosus]
MSSTRRVVKSPGRALAWPLLLAVPAAVMLAACSKQDPAQGAGQAPPPPEVGVITAAVQNVPVVTELPGRTEASRIAQVRARAAGILVERRFTEGSDVKAGQVLFRIDAAPYEASQASARAQLARAEATLAQARAQAQRYEPLVKANAISQQDYIDAVATAKAAEADVAAAQAALQTAGINLGYATVTAPISGRIGRALVTEGALVGQGEVTQLATVQQIDPMYVNFTQPVADVMRLRQAIAGGKFKGAGGTVPVRVLLDDGSVYPVAGKLLFSDLTVDETTGQITLRAELPNPKGTLLPGMYVRVRLEQAQASDAILVPQQAVTRSNQGDTVLVVAPDGKFAPRQVKIASGRDGQWVVLDGLAAGDKVITDGFQKLRGATTVRPVPWSPGGAASQPAGPAASAPAAAPASAPAASAPAKA